jgi:hypothetical protein
MLKVHAGLQATRKVNEDSRVSRSNSPPDLDLIGFPDLQLPSLLLSFLLISITLIRPIKYLNLPMLHLPHFLMYQFSLYTVLTSINISLGNDI